MQDLRQHVGIFLPNYTMPLYRSSKLRGCLGNHQRSSFLDLEYQEKALLDRAYCWLHYQGHPRYKTVNSIDTTSCSSRLFYSMQRRF